ncbi:MAG: hypothetical protein KBG64_04480 [Clostridia bacterium]|nr:hypothetical protein [Clostridia bacterium]
MFKLNQKTDAPLLIVLGQSNAHGHKTRLPADQRILQPLKNVYGLSREKNQAFDLPDVTWSGFTSFGMNLGETQDHTCCLATEFARLWQRHIDEGNELGLPDLYVIQISVGGQGIASSEKFGNMWYKDREPILKPGHLFEVDISLYPLTVQILEKAVWNLRCAGKVPKVIGLHWNQWETEVDTGGDAIRQAGENLTQLFRGFREAAGQDFVIYLYRPLSEVYQNPEGLKVMTDILNDFTKDAAHYQWIDLSKSELYDERLQNKGIFQDDGVHYHCEAHKWFAKTFFDHLFFKSEDV